MPLDEKSEIVRTCNHDRIRKIDIIPVGIGIVYNSFEAWELGHDGEEAHRLRPAVSEGSFCRKYSFVAEPLIEDIIEQHHAGVHVETALAIQDLMSHNVCHGGSTRETSMRLDLV